MFPSRHLNLLLTSLSFFSASASFGIAAGLERDAADARSLGMGGAVNATDAAPFAGIISNPAALGWLDRPSVGLSLNAGILRGRFTDRDGSSSTLSEQGVAPDGVISLPLTQKLTLGLGASVHTGLAADWRYRDVPGGADGRTSYGDRVHRSEIDVARATVGLGW